jgi:Laminin G domain.
MQVTVINVHVYIFMIKFKETKIFFPCHDATVLPKSVLCNQLHRGESLLRMFIQLVKKTPTFCIGNTIALTAFTGAHHLLIMFIAACQLETLSLNSVGRILHSLITCFISMFYSYINISFRTLNFNNQPMWVGGLASADAILERPGQIHSDDLVGCVHSVSVNGRALNLSNPLRSWEVDPTCGRSGRSPCSAPENTVSDTAPCGPMGSCLDRWKTVACVCHRSGIRK